MTNETGIPVMIGNLTVFNVTPTSFEMMWEEAVSSTELHGYEYYVVDQTMLDHRKHWIDIGRCWPRKWFVTGLDMSHQYEIGLRAADISGDRSVPITTMLLPAGAVKFGHEDYIWAKSDA